MVGLVLLDNLLEGGRPSLSADPMWIVGAVVLTTSRESFIGNVPSSEMHH